MCGNDDKLFVNEISLIELRETYGVPTGGLNVIQIIEILNEYNVPAKSIKVNDVQKLSEIQMPFIVHWNTTHFVIVEKQNNKKVSIVDPAKGKLKIPLEEFEKSFSNVVIYSAVERKKSKTKLKKNKSLLNIIKDNRSALVWTIAFSFLLQLLTLFIPIYMKRLIDNYNSAANFSSLILVLLLIIAFYYSFSVIKMRLITVFHNNFDRALTSKTVSHLLQLPLKFFVNRGKGELIFTINRRIEIVADFLFGKSRSSSSIMEASNSSSLKVWFDQNSAASASLICSGIWSLDVMIFIVIDSSFYMLWPQIRWHPVRL